MSRLTPREEAQLKILCEAAKQQMLTVRRAHDIHSGVEVAVLVVEMPDGTFVALARLFPDGRPQAEVVFPDGALPERAKNQD